VFDVTIALATAPTTILLGYRVTHDD
jgi:hypothetical protein